MMTASKMFVPKNDTQRLVLEVLSDWSLHSKEEIQSVTGVTFNAIRIQVHRLRKKLQTRDKDILVIRSKSTSFYRLVSFLDPDA